MNFCNIEELSGVIPKSVESFLEKRFDRALLILGDLTQPLRSLTRILIAYKSDEADKDTILGCAVEFNGFRETVISVVADDPLVGIVMLEAVKPSRSAKLVCNSSEPLVQTLAEAPSLKDLWLTRETGALPTSDFARISLQNKFEIESFYDSNGAEFWTPAMLEFEQTQVHYNKKGELDATAGVNFILTTISYGHIGNIVTIPNARRRGLATTAIGAVVGELYKSGISTCGLFVDISDDMLFGWYSALGFMERGVFIFVNIEDIITKSHNQITNLSLS